MSRLLELAMEGQKPLVTGSLVFRDASAGGVDLPPGMKLMMVVGVVAVPENFPVNTEEQVRIQGFANRDSVELHTQVHGKPIGDHYAGWELGRLLLEPIWRI